MQVFPIQVTEAIIHYVDVPARNLEDALEKAKEMITDETVWDTVITSEEF